MNGDDRSVGFAYAFGFLVRTAVLSALSCTLGLAVLHGFLSRKLGDEPSLALHALQDLRSSLVPALTLAVVAALLPAVVAVFAVAVSASHKIAGPLFRLERVADLLSRGVLVGRIHLRPGDRAAPVAAAVNVWVAARTGRLWRLRRAADEGGAALRECERSIERGDSDGLRCGLAELRRCVAKFEDEYS